jgi:hypothetical protein
MNHNITVWDTYRINYWGITKCAHTSIKMALSSSRSKKFSINSLRSDINHKESLDQIWIHYDMLRCKYITRVEAARNGFENITVIRNPVDRFISQFHFMRKCNDIGILDIPVVNTYDHLLDMIETGDNLDIHFRPQTSFICENNKLLVDRIFRVEELSSLEQYLSISIPHYNKTDKIHKLSNSILVRLKKVFEADFNLYETTFL